MLSKVPSVTESQDSLSLLAFNVQLKSQHSVVCSGPESMAFAWDHCVAHSISFTVIVAKEWITSLSQ